MLQAVLTDFQRWGEFPTVTTLDARLDWTMVPADRVHRVVPGEHGRIFPTLVSQSMAALVIAPETAGVLASLSRVVERLDVLLLGSSSEAVEIAGDKWACYRRFCDAGLPAPRTRHAYFGQQPADATDDLRYPLIVKPVDGAGCDGVFLVRTRAEFPGALDRLQAATWRDDYLAAEYVSGVHASVSLLVARTSSQPLTLNGQDIVVTGNRLIYRGGTVPLEHPLCERAFEVAVRAASLISGLRGYVGVDLVLTDREAFVIEINPRLTTSAIGVRQAVDLNLAEALWRACVTDQLPGRLKVHSRATFAKDGLRVPAAGRRQIVVSGDRA
jgi:hypothetical protein